MTTANDARTSRDGKTADQEAAADHRFRKSLGIVGLVLLAILIALAANLLLLLFGGILLAVFLRSLTNFVRGKTSLPEGWSLALVVIGLVVLLGGMAWLLAEQADRLTDQLPRALERLGQRLEIHSWGRQILQSVPTQGDLTGSRTDVLGKVTGVFSATLSALTNVALVLFIGLFLAVDPGLYVRGVVRLVPPAQRDRAHQVLAHLGQVLRWWLLARLASMIEVGTLIALGLWLLEVPLALTLGLLAGLLGFIPNVGPLVSMIPGVLLALLQGPSQALYVLLMYLGVQAFDAYLVTPLLQQRTVFLPPALTLSAQLMLGVWLGGLGLTFATPLAAVALVLVKELYLQDVLGEPSGKTGP